MNEHIPWKTYKHHKTLALEERAYIVLPSDSKDDWLSIGQVGSPNANS